MSDHSRLLPLRIVLVAVGLIFVFALPALCAVWPSGWAWGHGHSHYLPMIVGLYATLGLFLLIAARRPDQHRSLIWFTALSSLVHAAIMSAQSIADPMERGHFLGDTPALVLVALALVVTLRGSRRA